MGTQKLKTGSAARDTHRKVAKCVNPYQMDLCKLYAFMARRATTKINVQIYRGLISSRRNKMPVKISEIASALDTSENKTIVAVPSTVVDDISFWECPAMQIVALRFSATARARIVKAGGVCMTFDQLAMKDPYAESVVFLKGDYRKRVAQRYMGLAPGSRFSTTRERLNRKKNKTQETTNAGKVAHGKRIPGRRLASAQKK